MGGRLLYFGQEWEKVSDDQFIRSIISEGYQIEFALPPPKFSRVITTHLPQEEGKKLCMIQEINSLLEKRAIEIVPNSQISAGFYSTVFLVEKKTGGYRMVLNLKSLNKFIRTQHFKMETLRSVVHSLDIGDWVFSLDLSDAYLHIPIHPKSKQYLRFAVDGIVYQYCALPFGIASAPRIFTKIVSVILSHLRQRGIQVHAYLDDWLIRGKCPNKLSVSQTLTVETIQRLGFIINWEKSNLAITQKIIYLGAFINLKSGQIFPTEDFVRN